MSRKSLRQQKKTLSKANHLQDESRHLHLVAGKHDHKHTHSLSPISADEVEKLHNINPEFVTRLFKIIENGLDAEKEETNQFYEALEREQENDKLAITSKANNDKRAMNYAFFTIFFLVAVGSIFIYLDFGYVGYPLVTVVLLGVVKAMLWNKNNGEDKDNN